MGKGGLGEKGLREAKGVQPSYRRKVRRLKEEPSLDAGETAEDLDRKEGGDVWILQCRKRKMVAALDCKHGACGGAAEAHGGVGAPDVQDGGDVGHLPHEHMSVWVCNGFAGRHGSVRVCVC